MFSDEEINEALTEETQGTSANQPLKFLISDEPKFWRGWLIHKPRRGHSSE